MLTATGGTINFNSGETISPTTITLNNSTFQGSDNITLAASGTFHFSAGSLNGTGIVTIPSTGTLNLDVGSKTLNQTLDTSGTTNWTAGNVQDASSTGTGFFDNQNNAQFFASAAASFICKFQIDSTASLTLPVIPPPPPPSRPLSPRRSLAMHSSTRAR